MSHCSCQLISPKSPSAGGREIVDHGSLTYSTARWTRKSAVPRMKAAEPSKKRSIKTTTHGNASPYTPGTATATSHSHSRRCCRQRPRGGAVLVGGGGGIVCSSFNLRPLVVGDAAVGGATDAQHFFGFGHDLSSPVTPVIEPGPKQVSSIF